jgi:asparagine synthase (glutamine-hydrolysing)
MSAIAGIVDFGKTMNVEEQGNRIMKVLEAYPADDVRVWSEDVAFLGCHAQWITPESRQERLPYLDRERRLVVSSDAIIDNRDELFAIFQIRNERKQSITDSELIARAYERWGEHSPKHLVGDFAFLIWDMNKRTLFAARDFSGGRTLYFCRSGTAVAFCTIIRPLFALPGIEKKLNEQWLAEFLAITTNSDSTDIHSTAYLGIEQLPPSHHITITDKGVSLIRYSILPSGERLRLKSNEEYEEAFRDVFGKAVDARLRTHRPIGAHLSGGLDSSSVVGFASKTLRKSNKRLLTFSCIPVQEFEDWTPSYQLADERPLIRSAVQYAGNVTDHYLSLEDRNCFSDIDEWLDTIEAPYKYFVNSYWIRGIYQKASELDVGVLLSGARGNSSISWGPVIDCHLDLFRKLKWLRFHRELKLYCRKMGIGRKHLVKPLLQKAFPSLYGSASPAPSLVGEDLARRTKVYEKLRERYAEQLGLKMLGDTEFRSKHFGQLFHWNFVGMANTKLSLRYSLWDRDPTNDLRVIRFCLSLPYEQFVQHGMDRALIRRASEGYVPDPIRLNQRSRGIQGADGIFRMLSSWNAFIGEIETMKSDSAVSGILNMQTIAAALDKFKSSPRPEQVFDAEFKALMQSLIVYRFIKKIG